MRPRLPSPLLSQTIAVHVRYNFLYISLPSSTKQQREITQIRIFNLSKFLEQLSYWTDLNIREFSL